MLFSWPLMCAIQEISARIGRMTGRGIARNLKAHYPRSLLVGLVGLLLFANTVSGFVLTAQGLEIWINDRWLVLTPSIPPWGLTSIRVWRLDWAQT
jgi:hypothetical protein